MPPIPEWQTKAAGPLCSDCGRPIEGHPKRVSGGFGHERELCGPCWVLPRHAETFWWGSTRHGVHLPKLGLSRG